jgi:hypothetical protein
VLNLEGKQKNWRVKFRLAQVDEVERRAVLRTLASAHGRKLTQEEINTLERPLLDLGWKKTSSSSPIYVPPEGNAVPVFSFSPNLRKPTFQRVLTMLCERKVESVLLTVKFDPDIDLGSLGGHKLPLTCVRPLAYFVCGQNRYQGREVSTPPHAVFHEISFGVVFFQEEENAFFSNRVLTFVVTRSPQVEKSTNSSAEQSSADNLTLAYTSEVDEFCKSIGCESSSDRPANFLLELPNRTESFVARDWLAYLVYLFSYLDDSLIRLSDVKIYR